MDRIIDGGNGWYNVNKITKLSNTYPFSHIGSTNITTEYMDQRLGGVYTVKDVNEYIPDTGTTHDMYPNYGSIFYYYHSYSGD